MGVGAASVLVGTALVVTGAVDDTRPSSQRTLAIAGGLGSAAVGVAFVFGWRHASRGQSAALDLWEDFEPAPRP